MFSTKNVEGSANSSSYITYGINDVTIVGFKSKDENNLDLELKLKGAEDSNANSYRFWLTGEEKSIERNMSKLKAIQLAVMTMEEANTIEGTDLNDFINKLNAKMIGKSFRAKFIGKEVAKNDGNGVIVFTDLPYMYFTEAIEEGAELPAIPDIKNTKLKFDQSNQYDYRKLESTPETDVADTPSWTEE